MPMAFCHKGTKSLLYIYIYIYIYINHKNVILTQLFSLICYCSPENVKEPLVFYIFRVA